MKFSVYNDIDKEDKIKISVKDDTQSVWEPLHYAKEWKDLGLNQHLLNAVAEIGYNHPSKIQGIAITAILRKPYKNFIGQAQSGTGKTASFLLSMLSRVDPSIANPQILCLAHTRELARQIFEVGQKLAKYTTILFGLAIPQDKGGFQKHSQQIIIGTPGTISLLLDKDKIPTENIRMIVIDEADEMLFNQGGDKQTRKILAKFTKTCQICLFSATYSDAVRDFIHKTIPQPIVEITVPVEKLSLEALKQVYVDCKSEDRKLAVLEDLYNHVSVGQSIIFTQTRRQAAKVKKDLKEKGHEVSILHGAGKYYSIRDKIIDSFKKGQARILVTTNLLARGIDVLQVSLVVNYDLPILKIKNESTGVEETKPDFDTYLHRIGRSARYGKPGLAVNFIHDEESKTFIKEIKEYYKKDIEELDESKFEDIDGIMEKLASFYERNQKVTPPESTPSESTPTTETQPENK